MSVDNINKMETPKKAVNHMSKKKYAEFNEALRFLLAPVNIQNNEKEVLHTNILRKLCTILKFDPEANSYNKEQIERRKQQQNKNTYELNYKAYYLRNKDEINKRRNHQRKLQRANENQLKDLHQIEQACLHLQLAV